MALAAWRDPELRAAVMQAVGLGLSQRQIAARLGVSQTRVCEAIHQRRAGESLPPPSVVRPPEPEPRCQDCGCVVTRARYPRCRRCGRVALSVWMRGEAARKRAARAARAGVARVVVAGVCGICGQPLPPQRSRRRRHRHAGACAARYHRLSAEGVLGVDGTAAQIEAALAASERYVRAQRRRITDEEAWRHRGEAG